MKNPDIFICEIIESKMELWIKSTKSILQ
jgi:hypothetical protein